MTHEHETTTLRNDAEAFRQGREAGTAQRNGDYARVRVTRDYFRRWVAAHANDAEARRRLSDAYRDGYMATAPTMGR